MSTVPVQVVMGQCLWQPPVDPSLHFSPEQQLQQQQQQLYQQVGFTVQHLLLAFQFQPAVIVLSCQKTHADQANDRGLSSRKAVHWMIFNVCLLSLGDCATEIFQTFHDDNL